MGMQESSYQIAKRPYGIQNFSISVPIRAHPRSSAVEFPYAFGFVSRLAPFRIGSSPPSRLSSSTKCIRRRAATKSGVEVCLGLGNSRGHLVDTLRSHPSSATLRPQTSSTDRLTGTRHMARDRVLAMRKYSVNPPFCHPDPDVRRDEGSRATW
jgi:hypothetical protein